MWIMSFLPNWIFHVILLTGIAALLGSFIIKFIPFISTYKLPIQIGALTLILLATWFEGAISNQRAWEAKVTELQAKVVAAELKSNETNTKIVTKVVKQIELIRTRGDDIVKYIDREVVKYDTKFAAGGTCEIPPEFVKAINNAAEKPK